MKRISSIVILTLTIGFLSCTNLQGNQGNTELKTTDGDEQVVESGAPEYLTYDTFLEKVWNFEENPQEWIYEGDVPCVIDFYADWCKPCRMVAPIMDDLAKDYDGKVKIYKIDVDKEKRLASVFQVRSIPSVLFSPTEGKPIMQAGALPKDQYIQIIEKNLIVSQEAKQ